MEITEVRDDVIVDAVRESVRAAYKVDLYGSIRRSVGRVVRQVNIAACGRNGRITLSEMIERMAPEIIRQVIANALEAAVKAEVKRQLKALPPHDRSDAEGIVTLDGGGGAADENQASGLADWSSGTKYWVVDTRPIAPPPFDDSSRAQSTGVCDGNQTCSCY